MLQKVSDHELAATGIFLDQPGDHLPFYATTPETRPLGYALQSVEVPDISDDSPEYELTHAALAELEAELERNPQWVGPTIDEQGNLVLDGGDPEKNGVNKATEMLYSQFDDGTVNATREWYTRLVPSALALESLAMKSDTLPVIGVPIDPNTLDVFTHSADAISIRTRGALMAELLVQHASDKNPETPQRWLSLACGAARPVLEAAARVKDEFKTPIDVTLVDYDRPVLDYSAQLADGMDASMTHTEIESNLMRTLIARDTLVEDLGEESMDVVDLLGFLEYCRDKEAVKILRNAHRMVAGGGTLITSNMRTDRPEKEFHTRGIGWPGVQMRSSDEIVALAIEAGIDPSSIEAYQPDDGVYTVLKITKRP